MIDAILNTLKKTQAFMINISVRFEALTAQNKPTRDATARAAAEDGSADL